MATITYNCSVCARSIDLVENQQGLTTFSKCVITYGCKGKLLAVKRNPDNIRGTFPTEVPGLEDYIPRNVLFNYSQTTATLTWTINHNLNTVPAISIYVMTPLGQLSTIPLDVNQYVITTVNQNTLLITFQTQQSGVAQCISRNTITPPVVAAPTAVTLSQVTANGVFTFAVPKYLTRFDYPPTILPQPSLPFDLINNSNIRIEVTITLPNVAPVTCTEYLSTSLSSSPWLGWNEILVRKRKNCYVFAKNILDFRTFGGQITSLSQIPTGTQLEITRIDYGTGVLQPIDTEGLYILLANSPYTSNDKVLDTIIDVGDMVDNDIPYFSFTNTDFYVDPSNVDATYPNIAQVTKPKAFIVPSLTPSPTPTLTVSVSNTPPPTVTPTPSTTQTPQITPSAAFTYDEAVEDKGPEAYWPLNTDLTDVIDGNNLLYVSGADNVDLIADAFGHYLYFEEPSLGLTLTNPISLTKNFSLEAWIDVESLNSSGNDLTIFGTSAAGLQWFQGTLSLTGVDDYTPLSSITLSPSTTYHIVVTVDGSGNVLFYINGTQYTSTPQITETYQFEYVGNDGDGDYFYGIIGNPAIYDFVLTQAQVLQNYNIGTTTYRYAEPLAFPTPTPTASAQPTPTPTITVTPTPAVAIHYLSRLTSTGAVDPTFTSVGLNSSAYLPLQTVDENIYVGGEFSTPYNGLIRLTSTGAIDDTFANVGLASGTQAFKCLQSTDGHIYVGGNTSADSNTYKGLVRLTSTGILDTSFTPITNSPEVIWMLQAADGHIYISGFAGSGELGFLRLNSDGTYDSTYTSPLISGLIPNAIIQTSDGKIYCGGGAIQRLNSDGSVDDTYTNITELSVNTMIQDALGYIYVGQNNSIIRLTSAGVVDDTFTTITTNDQILNMIQTTDGHIYFGGFFGTAGGLSRNSIARLNSDGTFDTTYNTGLTGGSGIQGITQTLDGNIYLGRYF